MTVMGNVTSSRSGEPSRPTLEEIQRYLRGAPFENWADRARRKATGSRDPDRPADLFSLIFEIGPAASLWPLWNPVAVDAASAAGCAPKGATGGITDLTADTPQGVQFDSRQIKLHASRGGKGPEASLRDPRELGPTPSLPGPRHRHAGTSPGFAVHVLGWLDAVAALAQQPRLGITLAPLSCRDTIKSQRAKMEQINEQS
jgi:hypothetical protein